MAKSTIRNTEEQRPRLAYRRYLSYSVCMCFCLLADVNLDQTNQIKSNQIRSNQIKSNQIKSNQIKSNQIKSNQIKSNQATPPPPPRGPGKVSPLPGLVHVPCGITLRGHKSVCTAYTQLDRGVGMGVGVWMYVGVVCVSLCVCVVKPIHLL